TGLSRRGEAPYSSSGTVPTASRRNRKAELCPLVHGRAQLDALDRADRDDHLARHVVPRVWTDRHETVTRLCLERLDRIPGAVRELDLDECLLDSCLPGELLDPAMDAVDQIVGGAGVAGNPELRHA